MHYLQDAACPRQILSPARSIQSSNQICPPPRLALHFASGGFSRRVHPKRFSVGILFLRGRRTQHSPVDVTGLKFLFRFFRFPSSHDLTQPTTTDGEISSAWLSDHYPRHLSFTSSILACIDFLIIYPSSFKNGDLGFLERSQTTPGL